MSDKSIDHHNKQIASNIRSTITIRITRYGVLEISGFELGQGVKEDWGDIDYEYWIRIKKKDVSRVLLELMKDRFERDPDFMEWLDNKKIPYTFDSYI
jgi:hypothetical protein